MEDLSLTLKQFSALAQETRLQVFRRLMEVGPDGIQAGALARELDLPPNNLSGHLAILTESTLIKVRRDGRFMIYSANIESVNSMLNTLVERCCHGHPEICAPLTELSQVKC